MLAPSSAFISGLQLVAQQPDLAGHRVVADEQLAVAHDAAAEAGAERDAEEVLVALGAAGLFEQAVDVGQKAGDGLAIDEQVAVVVDEGRDAESLLEHRPERHAAAEAGQIAQVADDARRDSRPGRERRS